MCPGKRWLMRAAVVQQAVVYGTRQRLEISTNSCEMLSIIGSTSSKRALLNVTLRGNNVTYYNVIKRSTPYKHATNSTLLECNTATLLGTIATAAAAAVLASSDRGLWLVTMSQRWLTNATTLPCTEQLRAAPTTAAKLLAAVECGSQRVAAA